MDTLLSVMFKYIVLENFIYFNSNKINYKKGGLQAKVMTVSKLQVVLLFGWFYSYKLNQI